MMLSVAFWLKVVRSGLSISVGVVGGASKFSMGVHNIGFGNWKGELGVFKADFLKPTQNHRLLH